jgi:proteasome accessory factor C
MSTKRGPRSAEERVSGLLRMLPWLMQREHVSIAEMAQQFSISEADLIEDLEMTAMCGVPPYSPYELTEIMIDEGTIFIGPNKHFDRSLELSASEAFGLSLLATAAEELPGFSRGKDLKNALKKLRKVLGEGIIDVDAESPEFLDVITEAAASGERLRISYWTPARNEESERVITVRMVFTDRGRWYITADDDLSGDSRHFRVDRIRSIEKTGEFASVSTIAAEVPVWFADAQDNIVVSAHVSPAASWVIETYPCTVVEEHADGSFDISIVANSAHWLGRLLLRAGGGVVVTAPANMVEVYAQVAADVLVRYRSSSSDT